MQRFFQADNNTITPTSNSTPAQDSYSFLKLGIGLGIVAGAVLFAICLCCCCIQLRKRRLERALERQPQPWSKKDDPMAAQLTAEQDDHVVELQDTNAEELQPTKLGVNL